MVSVELREGVWGLERASVGGCECLLHYAPSPLQLQLPPPHHQSFVLKKRIPLILFLLAFQSQITILVPFSMGFITMQDFTCPPSGWILKLALNQGSPFLLEEVYLW